MLTVDIRVSTVKNQPKTQKKKYILDFKKKCLIDFQRF